MPVTIRPTTQQGDAPRWCSAQCKHYSANFDPEYDDRCLVSGHFFLLGDEVCYVWTKELAYASGQLVQILLSAEASSDDVGRWMNRIRQLLYDKEIEVEWDDVRV